MLVSSVIFIKVSTMDKYIKIGNVSVIPDEVVAVKKKNDKSIILLRNTVIVDCSLCRDEVVKELNKYYKESE